MKHQFDLINIVEFFKTVFASRVCGLEADREEGRKKTKDFVSHQDCQY
ncbi:hypothetical protein [Desulfobacter vibrioformis]|nr:hypothetical protein [Desulfobacter vibrioformis]